MLGVGPRILAAVGSGLGATVVIAGALWSAWRLWRGRARPGAQGGAPRGAGGWPPPTWLIAVGTLVISVKRPFEVLTGSDETGFALALSVGIAVMFAGFLLRRCRRDPPPRPAHPEPARPEHRRAAPSVPRGAATPREPATR